MVIYSFSLKLSYSLIETREINVVIDLRLGFFLQNWLSTELHKQKNKL